MNLPLHFGLLGTLEAGLIALLVGLLVYALWHRLCRALGWLVCSSRAGEKNSNVA